MKQQEVLAILQNIITPYLDDLCEIEMETDLRKDLAINSVDFVNIVTEIEDIFNYALGEKIFNAHIIKDIVEYIIDFE